MREPSVPVDGWGLANGEEYHAKAPQTFAIPQLSERQNLKAGDFAKLLFRINVDGTEDGEVIERMWVVVTERTSDGYIGVLNNDPESIDENDRLWSGTELPFATHHIISIAEGDADSRSLAAEEPRTRWIRS
jgi:hypothetical protein